MPRPSRTRGLSVRDTRVHGLGEHATSLPAVPVYSGNRIQVSSSDAGPYNFKFGVNPTVYDAQDSNRVSFLSSLHGSDIYQKERFDNKDRTLGWLNFPIADLKIDGIINYFRSIKGETRYFNFHNMDVINSRWPSSEYWKKARVIGVDIKYKEGGALVYNRVDVKLKPEM